jgi:branched-chain amino acid transport system permease protein
MTSRPAPPAAAKPPSALAEAARAALIAAGLFIPLVGLKTEGGPNGVTLIPRPLPVLLLVLLAAAGRLLVLGWGRWRAARQTASIRGTAWRLPALPIAPYLAPALIALALAAPLLLDRAKLDLGILILTYVMLGSGLNIVVGLAGLLDLGYVAFYAVGAYSFALLAQATGLGFWTLLPVSGLLAALWGMILGFPVLRLRGDYLAIVTLAFGEIIRVVLLNWVSLTGGPNGIAGIPRPTFFGHVFTPSGRVVFLYYVILALVLLTDAVSLRLRRLPLGRVWEALREDEIACRALGINITTTKLSAFAIGAFFGGLAGCFFATRQGFISPESFTFMESATVLAIVVLGGMGSPLGVALAAIVMIGLPEAFRALADYRMLIFGLALVTVMILRPRGLIAERRPSVVLSGKRQAIAAAHVAEGRG